MKRRNFLASVMSALSLAETVKANEDQLKKQLEDLSKESFNLRFQSSNGQLSNTGRVKEVRKGIAKVKTILNEITLNKE